MTGFASSIFAGHVVHKRLTPKQHAFSYKVFSLCLDVDEIDLLSSELRLFSRNRRNVLSFYDADHGAGDGSPVAEYIRKTLAAAGLGQATDRITVLCYPRVLGFVFNPLSVFFCYDAGDRLGAIVYEVSNTFHERVSYVIPVDQAGSAVVRQVCAKDMYVSPFTQKTGRYDFHVLPPGKDEGDAVVVGISLRDASGPVLKTHFRGLQYAMSDRTLGLMLVRHPLMTIKVVAAIHMEAARLWLKGVPLVRRQVSPPNHVTIVAPDSQQARHAK